MIFKSINTAAVFTFLFVCFGADADAGELKLRAAKVKSHGVATTLKGTLPVLPDLVVKPYQSNMTGLPNTGVCGAWSGGYTNVRFRVKNQGTVAVDLSSLNLIMQINGAYVGGAVLQVHPIGAGKSRIVTFPVPNGAQPGLNDTLVVKTKIDSPNYIPETNEANNNLNAFCMGPQS